MAINNKPASAYAKPHTMSGAKVGPKEAEAAVTAKGNGVDEIKMTVGNTFKKQNDEVKDSGIKIRGTGAATKGVMARGPMA
jgi:uncharacterized protein YukJ